MKAGQNSRKLQFSAIEIYNVSLCIIYRSSYFLSKTSLRTLYNSLVLPYLYYCNLVWGSTYKSNLKRLTILQKRAIRIVNRSGCDAHTDPIFKELRFLKMKGIHLLQLGQFMYSFSTGNLPTKFDSFFSVNNSIHSYNTRHASLQDKHKAVFYIFSRS